MSRDWWMRDESPTSMAKQRRSLQQRKRMLEDRLGHDIELPAPTLRSQMGPRSDLLRGLPFGDPPPVDVFMAEGSTHAHVYLSDADD